MFYDPLTLLKLNFLKKEKIKKIIKTWIVEYHNSIYYISHKRKDGARARRIRKEKRRGKKKKISRGRDSCVAYSKMAVDHHSLRRNVVTPN